MHAIGGVHEICTRHKFDGLDQLKGENQRGVFLRLSKDEEQGIDTLSRIIQLCLNHIHHQIIQTRITLECLARTYFSESLNFKRNN